MFELPKSTAFAFDFMIGKPLVLPRSSARAGVRGESGPGSLGPKLCLTCTWKIHPEKIHQYPNFLPEHEGKQVTTGVPERWNRS